MIVFVLYFSIYQLDKKKYTKIYTNMTDISTLIDNVHKYHGKKHWIITIWSPQMIFMAILRALHQKHKCVNQL